MKKEIHDVIIFEDVIFSMWGCPWIDFLKVFCYWEFLNRILGKYLNFRSFETPRAALKVR